MPTIREWMHRYNELVAVAQSHGVTRGPDGALLHTLTNLRVSNDAARERVRALEAYLNVAHSPPTVQQVDRAARRELSESNIADVMRGVFQGRATPRSFQTPPPAITTTTPPTFGIEIECLFPNRLTMGQIAAALNEHGIATEAEMYNHSRRPHWKIVTDASLFANPNTNPYEIVSPVLSGQAGLDQITKVCTALTELRAVVNRSCGFHVHVGVSRDLDNVNFFRRIVSLYKHHAPQIEKVLAPSRRQGGGNSYCRDFRTHTDADLENTNSITGIVRLVNGPDERHDRYYKLNLNAYFRHRTVEFRQHQGTLDAQKATMWTRFCLKLVAAAAKTTTLVTANNLADLLTQIEASADERTYFLARETHFQTLENSGDV